MGTITDLPRIGLALGSGASRGWSHVGVINALVKAGIEPDIVCGTSVGAMVGGAYVAGNLKKLEDWVLGSSRSDVYRFFDIKFSQAGFVNDERMYRFLHSCVVTEDQNIADLPKPYVAIATDLYTGREIWFRQGNAARAIRASMAMPGLFKPVRIEDQWLVDGGLVNPVPVSACHALGAEVVIAVNLNSDILGKRNRKTKPTKETPAHEEAGVLRSLKQQAIDYSSSLFSRDEPKDDSPGLFSAISSSINIFQDRITRSRLAGDPADVMISPRLGDIGLLEFGKAAEAMREGEQCVERALTQIQLALER